MKDDARTRVRAMLASKKGPELIESIADEIADLHASSQRMFERLKQLQLYQSFSERVRLLDEAGAAAVLPKSARVDAAQFLLPENGFFGIQYEPSGRPYRWTGPAPEFSFVLYVDRNRPLKLRIDIAYMVDRTLQKEITLAADDIEVPMTWSERDTGGGSIGETELPPREGIRATSLVFRVPVTLPAKNANDARLLGVAFRELSVRPAHEEAAATGEVLPKEMARAEPVFRKSASALDGPVKRPTSLAVAGNMLGEQRKKSAAVGGREIA